MQLTTTLNGTMVVIDSADSVNTTRPLDSTLEVVAARVRDHDPTTPDEVLASVVAALGEEIGTIGIEDQLELRRVVTYPGTEEALPDEPAIAETIEAVLSTFGRWRGARDQEEISA